MQSLYLLIIKIKKKFRIGLLIDDYIVPEWTYALIKNLISSNHSEIRLVIKKRDNNSFSPNFFKKVYKHRNHLLYLLYSKIDSLLYKKPPCPFKLRSIKDILTCHEIEVEPRQTKNSDYILESDLLRIEEHKLDLVVRLGFRILRGRILKFLNMEYGHIIMVILKKILVVQLAYGKFLIKCQSLVLRYSCLLRNLIMV